MPIIEERKRKRREEEKKRKREREEKPKTQIEEQRGREQEQRKFEQEKDVRRLQAEGFLKTPEQKEEETKIKEGEKFLEEKEFDKERLPERVELDIEREGAVAGLPVLGPISVAGGNALRDLLTPNVKDPKLKDLVPVRDTLIQNPETQRQIALQKVQQKEVEIGTTASENFGAFVESIPVAGPLVSKWVGGTIESPHENTNTAVKELKDERGRANKIAEKVLTGRFGSTPFEAYDQIEDIEDNIYRLEQRIKNLSIQSPELVADADQLNVIETKILRSKEAVSTAKSSVAEAIRNPALIGTADANTLLLSLMRGGEDEE